MEFRLGDYQHELGIIDAKYAPKGATAGPGGAVVFWHVDDVAEMLKKVLAMGAKEYEPLINREAGFVTAAVVDPFRNILGLMCNPHYLEILAAKDAILRGQARIDSVLVSTPAPLTLYARRY